MKSQSKAPIFEAHNHIQQVINIQKQNLEESKDDIWESKHDTLNLAECFAGRLYTCLPFSPRVFVGKKFIRSSKNHIFSKPKVYFLWSALT